MLLCFKKNFWLFLIPFIFFPIIVLGKNNNLVRVQAEEIGTGNIRNFNFTVRDANSVSRDELQRMVEVIAEHNGRPIWQGRWNVPDVEKYVGCPHWVPWTPCEVYDREIYVNCVAQRTDRNGSEQLSREAREGCYYTALRPSLIDRMRYR